MAKINVIVAAVADRHVAEHFKSPTADPSFRKMMVGLRKQPFKPSRSKSPLDKDILQDAFELIQGGGRLQDSRTLVRINIEFYGMMCWAEVSASRMDDIRFTSSAMILRIQKSKTDQLGESTYVKILSTDEEHCPVEIT